MFSVFPNPSSGVVKLKLNCGENVSVQVFDVIGKMVYSCDNQSYNEVFVNDFLSNLDGGVYFVRVVDGNLNQIGKLIKY